MESIKRNQYFGTRGMPRTRVITSDLDSIRKTTDVLLQYLGRNQYISLPLIQFLAMEGIRRFLVLVWNRFRRINHFPPVTLLMRTTGQVMQYLSGQTIICPGGKVMQYKGTKTGHNMITIQTRLLNLMWWDPCLEGLKYQAWHN